MFYKFKTPSITTGGDLHRYIHNKIQRHQQPLTDWNQCWNSLRHFLKPLGKIRNV